MSEAVVSVYYGKTTSTKPAMWVNMDYVGAVTPIIGVKAISMMDHDVFGVFETSGDKAVMFQMNANLYKFKFWLHPHGST